MIISSHSDFPSLSLESALAATGAIRMWRKILRSSLDSARSFLPPGSRLLEVGYGDGLLTCYLAREYGWSIVGLDCEPQAFEQAKANAARYGLNSHLDLRLIKPGDTWKFSGQYDAVFVKTVLYTATSLEQYGEWLDWVVSVLKFNGLLINYENGKTNRLTYWYRKLRGRAYADLCMFDKQIEELYRRRFKEISIQFYGALSQFVAPVPVLYETIALIEESLLERTADNSYVASILAHKT